MSKRLIWIGGILTLLVVAGFGWMKLHERPEWTTDSPAALAALQAGFEAQMKVYQDDAARHFEKALELDPDFVMAKLEVALSKSKGRKELLSELRRADLSRLSDRERFLVRYNLARVDGEGEAAGRILDDYLSVHPDDRYALSLAAGRAWSDGEIDRAQELYRRILAVSPNYVVAYNNLGYTAMQQGRFDKAEEYLSTYRYIAPDQANPHDSLGELYTLRGRYADATRELEAAIRVKPDFWVGYEHLMLVKVLEPDYDAAQEAVDRAVAAGVGEKMAHSMGCTVSVLRALESGWSSAWQEVSGPCQDIKMGTVAHVAQRAALVEGHEEAAEALVDVARKYRDSRKPTVHAPEEAAATVAHMEGVQMLFQGKAAEAVARFREADGELVYVGSGTGLFKLFNRLELVTALRRTGQSADADQVLAEVRDVNPVLASQYEEGAVRLLSWP